VSDADRLAEACARVMWQDDRASQLLGMKILTVRPGYARLRMRVDERMINGHELCHGGYLFALADSAFAFACNTYGQVTVASGADISFVTSARLGDQLVAEAVEKRRYGRSGLYDVTVLREPDGAVVAEFRGRSRSLATRILRDEEDVT
jgi:acyl-CoA thioesterase